MLPDGTLLAWQRTTGERPAGVYRYDMASGAFTPVLEGVILLSVLE
ncbi:MAG: hypothetical protein SF029_09825 [bacterium]|nr:hypothetical protein [bacterium]